MKLDFLSLVGIRLSLFDIWLIFKVGNDDLLPMIAGEDGANFYALLYNMQCKNIAKKSNVEAFQVKYIYPSAQKEA